MKGCQRDKGLFGRRIRRAAAVLFCALIMSSAAAAAPAVTLTSPAEGKKVSLVNSTVRRFCSDYAIGLGIGSYAGSNAEKPNSVKLKWSVNFKPSSSYTVTIATNRVLTADRQRFTTGNRYYSVSALKANTTYYWRVTCRYKGRTRKSKTGSFTTAAYPRLLYASGVFNLRDLGGYDTESGLHVRQGMVYRSAHLDKVKTAGRNMLLSTLKIKTDLDLRKTGEGTAGTQSPLGSSVRYIHISAPMYKSVWASEENLQTLVQEMQVFASESNYPIVFHCKYGRDRTGTLAFMLNALLGVSRKDLYMDWELTFLSYMGAKNLKYSDEYYLNRFNELYNYMAAYESDEHPVTGSAPLSSHVEAFLLDNGMSSAQISAIKNLLLV